MECIQNRIDDFYKMSHHVPSGWYKRTDRFRNSLRIESEKCVIKGGKLSYRLVISFNENAYHKSLVGKTVHVPLLMEFGWKHKNWNGGEDFFHQYSGDHFLEKGIEDFNRINKLGLRISIVKNGSVVRIYE